MTRLVSAGLLAAALSAPALAADPTPSPDPGDTLAFDVFRKGDVEFGEHVVTFERDGEDLVAETRIRLRAGLGPITVFRYEHDAVERWRDGELQSLTSTTLKDGERLRVEARREGDQIRVDGTTEAGEPLQETFPGDTLTSSHWHGYPAGTELLINTETGERLEVSVDALGRETVPADGDRVEASQFRLEGTLTVDLWYDGNGDWTKTRFTARDQDVTYVRRFDPNPEGEGAAVAGEAPAGGDDAGAGR